MYRSFTALSSAVAIGFAMQANALIKPADLKVSADGKQSELTVTTTQGQVSLAGQVQGDIFKAAAKDGNVAAGKFYSTSQGEYAVVQVTAGSDQGLFLLKKTEQGVQSAPIKADGLNSVEEVDQKLIQPLIAKHGMDSTLAQFEAVVQKTGFQEAKGDEEARIILIDGNYQERPRRRTRQYQEQYGNQGYNYQQGGGYGYGGGYAGGGGYGMGMGGGYGMGMGGGYGMGGCGMMGGCMGGGVIVRPVPVPVPVPMAPIVRPFPGPRPPPYNPVW